MVIDHDFKRHRKLVFASIVYPTKCSETNAVLLADSIRTFAGSLSRNTMLFFTPTCQGKLSSDIKKRLDSLDVAVVPFKIDPEILRFPLAGDVFAAAAAESAVCNQTEFLAWLGTNTVVLHEPRAFLLSNKKNLGYRPVHHLLIGSRCDMPIDEFWMLVYRCCKVPQNRIFPMKTHVDEVSIRSYFNAGILITRPLGRLLQKWSTTFFAFYQTPAFQKFYMKNKLYKIFIHQALLTGVILSNLEADELAELPPTYNYPLHLFAEDVTNHRPSSIDEVVTFRHENFYQNVEWAEKMPAGQKLKKWLTERIYK